MQSLSRLMLLTLALLTLVRWALAASMEVTPQEAYIYQLAQHRDYLGVDGGGLGTLLVGWFGKSALSIRWAAPLMALVGSWLLFKLIQALAAERVAAWAVVILNLLPAFNLGATQFQPEWLAADFTLLGMFWLWQGLHKASAWEWRWPAAGAVWGLALLSHWGAVGVPLGMIFVLSVSRRWRKRWLRPGPWLLLGAWVLVGWLPLLLWDGYHAGALTDRWLVDFGWAERTWSDGGRWLSWWAQLLVGISPLLLVAAAWAAIQIARARERDDASFFLLAWVLPALVLGCLGAWFGLGRTSWLIPILPALCGLLAIFWQPSSAVRDQRSLWQWCALGLAALVSLLLGNTDLLRRAGVVREYGWDVTRAWHGWRETALEVERIVQDTVAEIPTGVLLIAETPELAAVLDYHLPAQVTGYQASPNWPRVQLLETPMLHSQYAFWPRYDEDSGDESTPSPMAGRSALFFTDAAERIGPPAALAGSFTTVRPLLVFEVRRYGAVVRRMRVFLCQDYVGASL
jgi:hypothetical protein